MISIWLKLKDGFSNKDRMPQAKTKSNLRQLVYGCRLNRGQIDFLRCKGNTCDADSGHSLMGF
jgi:hypothetical protein